MNILDFYNKKKLGEKITMVTCYDFTSAKMLAKTSIDCLLVGDSVAMVMHGYKDTTHATLEMMIAHVAAVTRGAENKFIVGDLPFLSYRKSLSESISAAQSLIQAGAHAVKLEGAEGNLNLIHHFTESGIPVMGHLGLTPQFVHLFGGFNVQGKQEKAAARLQDSALQLQKAGCFAIVLECIPKKLAKEISSSLSIPTIGIGAGPDTDGQVMVYQDLLGLQTEFKPRFVKHFVNGYDFLKGGIEQFIHAIHLGEYPQDEHSYTT